MTGCRGAPSVASDSKGNFLVVWTSQDVDGHGEGIAAQFYDASGVPHGEFVVNAYTTEQQRSAVVVSTGGGSFIVMWYSWDGTSPYTPPGNFGRRVALDLIFANGFE